MHEVLSDASYGGLTEPLQLIHDGGGVTETQGVFTFLRQSVEQVKSAFSDSGPCVFVPQPMRDDIVRFVGRRKTRTLYRVLHGEPRSGGPRAGMRFMLQTSGETYNPDGPVLDFARPDFAPGDWA